jgi:hypothetical protein
MNFWSICFESNKTHFNNFHSRLTLIENKHFIAIMKQKVIKWDSYRTDILIEK